jgi:hypothetical protein
MLFFIMLVGNRGQSRKVNDDDIKAILDRKYAEPTHPSSIITRLFFCVLKDLIEDFYSCVLNLHS